LHVGVKVVDAARARLAVPVALVDSEARRLARFAAAQPESLGMAVLGARHIRVDDEVEW
jgi:hypothetical protein